MRLLLIPAAYLVGIALLWVLHVLDDERPAQYDSIWRTPPPAAILLGAPVVVLGWWVVVG